MSYNTQKTFSASSVAGTSGILIVDANGGSVTVAYEITTGTWVTMATFTADGAYEIDRRVTWRITPAGGAVYDVQ